MARGFRPLFPMSKRTLKDFKLDPANANQHSARGGGLMETSIEECGFGDSMVASSDGVILSGNQRAETCFGKDMTDAIIIESDGTRPVIHVRTDLKAEDVKAKRLAILSNRVGEVNLSWDAQALAELATQGVELDDLWGAEELTALLTDAQMTNPEVGFPSLETSDEHQITIRYFLEDEPALKSFVGQSDSKPLSPIAAGRQILERIKTQFAAGSH